MLQLDNNPHWNSVLQCWNKAKKSNEIGQKQSARGVLKKVAPKICWRTHMREWDFNKVANQFYWNHISAWVFSCRFARYFQNTFLQEQLWGTGPDWERVENSYICFCVKFTLLISWVLASSAIGEAIRTQGFSYISFLLFTVNQTSIKTL